LFAKYELPFDTVSNQVIPRDFDKRVGAAVLHKYQLHWRQELDRIEARSGKGHNILRTYRLIKLEWGMEWYFGEDMHVSARKDYALFRMGAHDLPIVTGRWKGLEAEKRVCDICSTGKVGDEIHFLAECETTRNLLGVLWRKIRNLGVDISTIEHSSLPKDIFIFLMTGVDRRVQHLVVRHIHSIFNLRRKLLKTM
jgi:hypothetical protein